MQPGHLMRALDIIERSRGPAVLTDRMNRILAMNDAASRLLEHSAASAKGKDLYDLLEVRDIFGNRLRSQSLAFVEMLTHGEPIAASEVELTLGSNEKARVSVAVVVVAETDSPYFEVVYLLNPIRRRRRADEAIERLLNSQEQAEAVSPGEQHRAGVDGVKLTPRQMEVLQLMADGKSTADIADELSVTVNTVRTHQQAILGKMEAHSQLQAVAIAIRRKLV